MKQAKVEANELIEGYRAEKQKEFNNMLLSKGGSSGDFSAKLQAETKADITRMEASFQKNSQKAIDVLLSKCCEVSLEVPTARIRSTQKKYGYIIDA
jgi:ATP synthase subunit G